MKKALFTFASVLFCTFIFASSSVEEKKMLSNKVQIKPFQNSVCETRTSTISNSSTGESITVSCTKCDDTAVGAAILATVCASAASKKLAGFI
jgi:hypothetical protein